MSEALHVGTPESVDLALEPAGLGSRFLASFIDGLVQGAVLTVLYMMFVPAVFLGAFFNPDGLTMVSGIFIAILFLVIGLLLFGYKLLFEALWNGQTIGKRAVGIRVVRADGLPVTFLQVLVRNLMRVVDSLPWGYLIGAVAVLASPRKQRLGDMVAGTIVVREHKAEAPVVPTTLSFAPAFDLNLLREHALRLGEQDLEPVRRFWGRRLELEPRHRARVGLMIAQRTAQRMGWEEPLPSDFEQFMEAVLYVRAH